MPSRSNKRSTLYLGKTGQTVTIRESNRIGSGGEGTVYALSGPDNLVAKIYDGRRGPPDGIGDKLALMIAAPPNIPTDASVSVSIAWPLDTLHRGRKRSGQPNPESLIGYIMPKITGAYSVVNYYSPQLRRSSQIASNYGDLLRIAINVAAATRGIHDENRVIGDINQSNIFARPDCGVTLIDTDSFQVMNEATGYVHGCEVKTPEYTPPELQGHPAERRVAEHDRFGMSVLIYQLLMQGGHPYDGSDPSSGGESTIDRRIRDGQFRHMVAGNAGAASLVNRTLWHALTPDLQNLFRSSFVFGHSDNTLRPPPFRWMSELAKAADSLATCSRDSRHSYFGHLQNCTWCELANALNSTDLFHTSMTRAAPRQAVRSTVAKPPQTPQPPRIPQKESGRTRRVRTRQIDLGSKSRGRLTNSQNSVHRSGSYARYFTFTLNSETSVTIDLESSQFDAYLYLYDEDGRLSREDDDSGSGTSARIQESLLPGRYVIEATSRESGETGSFNLTLSELSTSATKRGRLTDSEGSINRNGSYARHYKFTLNSETSVTIDLESSQFDAYLYLSDEDGRLLREDDDSGSGTSARIQESLLPGRYVIEATSHESGATGHFKLTVEGASDIVRTREPNLSGGALPFFEDGTMVGRWTGNSSISAHRSDCYARHYSFELNSRSIVTIDLESSRDAYLYLIDSAGERIASDDDSGEGTNARIRETLQAGFYTIEATTYGNRQTGSFELTLQRRSVPQFVEDGTTVGSWTRISSMSAHRNGCYARHYSFELNSRSIVTIDLESSRDAYLYLIDSAGERIASDDDSGGGTNARIRETLQAGFYTIEATTFGSRETGSFELTLQMREHGWLDFLFG